MIQRMLSRPLIGLLLSITVLAIVGVAYAGKEKKVTLCHVPPGNPGNPQTISVGESAVGAHLAHGDQLGECSAGCRSDAACNDGDACTSDACGSNGECAHETVNCDDGNVCTKDLCDQSTGCYAVANDGALCDDGNDCTNGDGCAGTMCKGAAIPGCCATSANCNDDDPCTVNSCVDGFCSTAQKDCSVADKCLAGFCDVTGACETTPVNCDDSDPCTADGCDAEAGCTHTPIDCAFCGDGVVQPEHPYCVVANCNSSTGSCVHNGPCSTGEEVVPGEQCDDGNGVPTDGCDNCIVTNPEPD